MDKDEYFSDEQEDDIYPEKEEKALLEDGEIALREEAFMMGYDEEISGSLENKTCKLCRREIDIEDNICPACGTSISDNSQAA